MTNIFLMQHAIYMYHNKVIFCRLEKLFQFVFCHYNELFRLLNTRTSFFLLHLSSILISISRVLRLLVEMSSNAFKF